MFSLHFWYYYARALPESRSINSGGRGGWINAKPTLGFGLRVYVLGLGRTPYPVSQSLPAIPTFPASLRCSHIEPSEDIKRNNWTRIFGGGASEALGFRACSFGLRMPQSFLRVVEDLGLRVWIFWLGVRNPGIYMQHVVKFEGIPPKPEVQKP